MRRALLGIATSIGLLAAASAGLVWWLTRPAPTLPALAGGSAGRPLTADPGEPSGFVSSGAGRALGVPATPHAPDSGWQAAPSPPAAPQATAPRPNRVSGKALRRAVLGGLREVWPRLARCGAPGVQGFGGDAADEQAVQGRSYLVVDVETLDGRARILEVEGAGEVGDGYATCARSALRGEIVTARDAPPGRRVRMAVPVRPVGS
ncbi:MAG TPA: hypothetical protein VFP50_00180 [Anaeromyxobacteraceae bacterium]|nr:hypothetical protein [Anaeromyxobacteraceae bacterium]